MTGYLWKVRSELAGIGLMNDPMATKFVKSEITTSAGDLGRRSRRAASLSGRLGVLMPWGSSDKEGELQTCIADRFFLGGVGCLRQFENNGVGPSDSRRSTSKSEKAASADEEPPLKRDALGGDFVWSAAAAIQMDVPGEKFEAMREAGIHFHAFANVGALLPIAAVPSARRTWRG